MAKKLMHHKETERKITRKTKTLHIKDKILIATRLETVTKVNNIYPYMKFCLTIF